MHYALYIALGASLVSCNHKDLCFAHPHMAKIYLVYDWSEAPEANPAGMCAFFYATDRTASHQRFDFPGAKGGEIEIEQGDYVLITYNNDTEIVQFASSGSFADHYAYTRTGDILEPLYGNGITSTAKNENGERVVITPDALWGCSATGIEIAERGVKYTVSHSRASFLDSIDENSDQVITLYPHDMLCHYSYEVRHVDNAKHISRVSGALSGMAGEMKLSDESLGTECVTLPVPGNANGDAQTITGEFLTFGHNAANTAAHKMSFYVVMDDGKKYSFKDAANLDVTSQVDNAPDRRHVHIVIDSLHLPSAMSPGEGFSPSVDDWGVVEQDLDI